MPSLKQRVKLLLQIRRHSSLSSTSWAESVEWHSLWMSVFVSPFFPSPLGRIEVGSDFARFSRAIKIPFLFVLLFLHPAPHQYFRGRATPAGDGKLYSTTSTPLAVSFANQVSLPSPSSSSKPRSRR